MLDTYILPPPAEGAEGPLKLEIRVLESEETYGKLAVEPLERGYAITIGNPLRRVLFGSIKGSAVTWVKVEGVAHEYTTLPNVKEEVMELLLNIKRIRIRSESGRPGKMRLQVHGEGPVCAGDISTPPDFQIINPELHLATLDSDATGISIEFNVESGVGYRSASSGEGSTGLPVGVLPVDAIFSPIRKVNYHVERTRVGQVTDYERLVLEVWTDGTISAVDAVQQAAENLVNHFFLLSNLTQVSETGTEHTLSVSPEVYQTPIEKLDLLPRTLNCLKRAHISKVGEILEMSDADLLKIRNFGEKSLVELHEKLAEKGIFREPRDTQGKGAGKASKTDDLDELMGAAMVDGSMSLGNAADDTDTEEGED